MASTVPRSPIDFDDPAAVRKIARIISLAIALGAAAFGVVVNMLLRDVSPIAAPTEHHLYTPFVFASAACVLVGSVFGSRMHTLQGAVADRCRRTFTLHVLSLGLAEGATLLGLVLVLITRSWDVVLPAAIGLAGLATTIIRGEFRFSRLVEEVSVQP